MLLVFCLFFLQEGWEVPGTASLWGGLGNLQAASRGDVTVGNSYPLSATESFSLIFKTISKCTSKGEYHLKISPNSLLLFLINCAWQ